MGFGQRKSKAIDAYKRFVSEGKNQPSPWEKLRNQVFLGDEVFVESMHRLIDADKELNEIPATQSIRVRLDYPEFFGQLN